MGVGSRESRVGSRRWPGQELVEWEWDGSWTGDPERSSRFWQPGGPGEPGGGNGPSASPLILGPTDPTRQLSLLQVPCCGGCATPAAAGSLDYARPLPCSGQKWSDAKGMEDGVIRWPACFDRQCS